VILNTGATCSTHINHVRKKAAQRLRVLRPLLNRRSGLSIRNGVLLYKQIIRPMMDDAFPPGDPLLAPISGKLKSFNLGVFALLTVHLSTLVTDNITMIRESPYLPTTSGL
jgi:hypothetical protein